MQRILPLMSSPYFDLTDEPPGERLIVYASPFAHGSKKPTIDSQDLKKYFNQFGEVHQSYVEDQLRKVGYVGFMNSGGTKKAIAHNNGVHIIKGSTVHVRRHPKPIRIVWPSSQKPILSSVQNISNNSGLDKPETLMSLVAPYLSYEDTCRCMQLNSNYYAFIDNNWEMMTKKTICLNINNYSENGSVDVEFADLDYIEDQCNVRQKIVHLSDNCLTTGTNSPFLEVFLSKNAALIEKSERKLVHSTENKKQGLQLILKALFLRFSMKRIVIDISDFDLLPVIEATAMEYHRSSSNTYLRFSIKDEISADFHKVAEALAVRRYLIGQHFIFRKNATINVNFLNANVMVIEMYSQEWDPQQMHTFITSWQDENRNIKGLHIHTTQCIDRKWEKKFDVLCELLSIESWHKEMDGVYLIQLFKIHRKDGKILKVLMKLYRGYGGYLLIHEETNDELVSLCN